MDSYWRGFMQIDIDKLARQYASMTDEELLSLDREDLTETAQSIYDKEIVRRGLDEPFDEDVVAGNRIACGGSDETIGDANLDPDWLQDGGACACSFMAHPGSSAAVDAAQAQAMLQAEGIPSCQKTTRDSEDSDRHSSYDMLNIMVPMELAVHAVSILDRDFFNERFEAEWRDQIKMLSDKDLLALDPEIFCAGLLDRVARMKKSYVEETAKRELKART
jgi:hypothetical protein